MIVNYLFFFLLFCIQMINDDVNLNTVCNKTHVLKDRSSVHLAFCAVQTKFSLQTMHCSLYILCGKELKDYCGLENLKKIKMESYIHTNLASPTSDSIHHSLSCLVNSAGEGGHIRPLARPAVEQHQRPLKLTHTIQRLRLHQHGCHMGTHD